MDHDVAMIVERGQYHAMTAAPVELGYPGYSIIFEISGHVYNPSANTKVSYTLHSYDIYLFLFSFEFLMGLSLVGSCKLCSISRRRYEWRPYLFRNNIEKVS